LQQGPLLPKTQHQSLNTGAAAYWQFYKIDTRRSFSEIGRNAKPPPQSTAGSAASPSSRLAPNHRSRRERSQSDHLRQALATFAPAPFPISKQPLQGRCMSRLEFPSEPSKLCFISFQLSFHRCGRRWNTTLFLPACKGTPTVAGSKRALSAGLPPARCKDRSFRLDRPRPVDSPASRVRQLFERSLPIG
jgi:hypothetical protein